MILPLKAKPDVSMTLIPPSLVSDKISLTARGAVWNHSQNEENFDVCIYLDNETPADLLHSQQLNVSAEASAGFSFDFPTAGKVGKHRVIFVARLGDSEYRTERPVEIVASDVRSTGRIAGAWAGLYHWSEQEGEYWNAALKTLTDSQWRDMVRAMHDIGMDIINIQEVFRNEEYVDEHDIPRDGYKGRAFYPSKLFPQRMDIAANDAIEAILDQADQLDMHVLLGIGMYAWFDYSPGSLEWHKKIATEVYELYGHHKSFYGFKISEEGHGSLGSWDADDDAKNRRHRQNLITFFREFTAHCRSLAPDKPVMVARNAWGIRRGLDTYPEFLENLDILCSFAFNRMPEGDMTGPEAIDILQDLCDQAGTHLWMDTEVFLFGENQQLYPSPIETITTELQEYPTFETIMCYQYPGLMNAPWASVKPGGEATVQLYNDYKQYLSRKL